MKTDAWEETAKNLRESIGIPSPTMELEESIRCGPQKDVEQEKKDRRQDQQDQQDHQEQVESARVTIQKTTEKLEAKVKELQESETVVSLLPLPRFLNEYPEREYKVAAGTIVGPKYPLQAKQLGFRPQAFFSTVSGFNNWKDAMTKEGFNFGIIGLRQDQMVAIPDDPADLFSESYQKEELRKVHIQGTKEVCQDLIRYQKSLIKAHAIAEGKAETATDQKESCGSEAKEEINEVPQKLEYAENVHESDPEYPELKTKGLSSEETRELSHETKGQDHKVDQEKVVDPFKVPKRLRTKDVNVGLFQFIQVTATPVLVFLGAGFVGRDTTYDEKVDHIRFYNFVRKLQKTNYFGSDYGDFTELRDGRLYPVRYDPNQVKQRHFPRDVNNFYYKMAKSQEDPESLSQETID